jgi:ketosteroid isomerase-like protein
MITRDDDVSAVRRANDFYYNAISSLSLSLLERAWAHEDYVILIGPRHSSPTIGWRDVWAYYERTVGFLGKISVKPIDPRIQVNGSCAWVIAREEIGNDSCAKDGTLISSRPTMSTNVFEKANGEWRMVSHHAQEILSV